MSVPLATSLSMCLSHSCATSSAVSPTGSVSSERNEVKDKLCDSRMFLRRPSLARFSGGTCEFDQQSGGKTFSACFHKPEWRDRQSGTQLTRVVSFSLLFPLSLKARRRMSGLLSSAQSALDSIRGGGGKAKLLRKSPDDGSFLLRFLPLRGWAFAQTQTKSGDHARSAHAHVQGSQGRLQGHAPG